MKNQWQLRDRGLTQAWDIEDLVTLGKKIKVQSTLLEKKTLLFLDFGNFYTDLLLLFCLLFFLVYFIILSLSDSFIFHEIFDEILASGEWFFALHWRVYSTVYSVLSECLWKKLYRQLGGGGGDLNPRPPAY